MSNEHTEPIPLQNDLILKISSLLMESIGSRRLVEIELDTFPLDSALTARDVTASIRLTRLNTGVLAQGTAEGTVELECVRCLNQFDYAFSTRFAEQFRQTLDISGGHGFTVPHEDREDDEGADELAFEINDAHEIDLTELLRQWILLALPMNPICGPNCPGPAVVQEMSEKPIDARFAALQDLLDTEDS